MSVSTCPQVRFDEVDSEATVQVEEPPAVQPWRKKTFDEQTALLSREDKDTLTRNIQGYAVFPMVSRAYVHTALDQGFSYMQYIFW